MKIVGALLEKDREAYELPPRDDEKWTAENEGGREVGIIQSSWKWLTMAVPGWWVNRAPFEQTLLRLASCSKRLPRALFIVNESNAVGD